MGIYKTSGLVWRHQSEISNVDESGNGRDKYPRAGQRGGQGGPEELTAATSFAPVPNAELSTRIYDLARRLPAGRAKRTTVSLAGLL